MCFDIMRLTFSIFSTFYFVLLWFCCHSLQRTEDDAAEAVQAYLEENPPSSPAGLPATSEIKHVGVFQLGNNGTCAYPIKLFTLDF